ncbi:MAG: SPOR domain-containing protein [Gammaproteobacteria bacterium]|nr:SPOR domain-containing protein [Gammaproteobacteria bacterium]MBU2058337.1 SPOR domain-containing protein [Gammaproteobacteria bacterium]MBU2176610.1 SPOR domain-containing protein [Gammaproteobacteria bacterium]MBU2248448.1 SPOR domain-containing protein [Gammaproteobacteria bacterium]MBU2345689.1 SPOR domain-containing protein [Gammaproteobacteria bacterium]
MVKYIAVVISMLGITGCSNTPEPTALSATELAEWQQLKPSIKRLAAIEGDLKELIVALDDMGKQQVARQKSTLGNDNVEVYTTERVDFDEQLAINPALPEDKQIPEDKAVVEQPQSASVAHLSEQEPVEPSPDPIALSKHPVEPLYPTGYSIQLASLKDVASTKSVWLTLQKRHPALLGDVDALVEQAMVKNTHYFRLKAAGFETRKQASDLCEKLRLEGASCIVTRSIGEPIEQLIAKI